MKFSYVCLIKYWHISYLANGYIQTIQANHVTGGNAQGAKPACTLTLEEQELFSFINFQVIDSLGGKTMLICHLGVMQPLPFTGTCLFRACIFLHFCRGVGPKTPVFQHFSYRKNTLPHKLQFSSYDLQKCISLTLITDQLSWTRSDIAGFVSGEKVTCHEFVQCQNEKYVICKSLYFTTYSLNYYKY